MMASIRLGLEAAMKVDRGRPAARAKLVDFVLVAAAGILVIVIVGLSAFGAFFSQLVDRFTEWAGVATPSGLLLRDGVQLVAIAVTVLLLYRFVPARKLRRRGAIAGADPHRASASGERRRSSRSSSPTSRATTSSTARSPA